MKKLREVYEELPEHEKKMVDDIFDAVNAHCKAEGIKIAYDDTAEKFIGDITGYLIDSGVIKV